MKFLPVLAALLLATPNVVAQEPGSLRFQTLQELDKWAKEGSFGGGSVDLLSDRGREIAIVNHMYTSGVMSSGITVFVKRSTAWVEALRLGPYWMRSVEFKQSGDSVVLKLTDNGQEILRFSISTLLLQFDNPSKKP